MVASDIPLCTVEGGREISDPLRVQYVCDFVQSAIAYSNVWIDQVSLKSTTILTTPATQESTFIQSPVHRMLLAAQSIQPQPRTY